MPDSPSSTHYRWDPLQYEKFADLRLRPALELLARVPLAHPRIIIDLGCGTGTVTRLLAKRWSSAQVYGYDSSVEMLERARSEPSNIRWQQADIAHWAPPPAPDLIFSNATLHWLDHHQTLLPRLAGYLCPGGCLAVQMPLSWNLPSHELMRTTLADCAVGGGSLGTGELRRSMARKWVEDAEFYYDVLAHCTASIDIWESEYVQVLAGDDGVLEWVRGTGLRPILEELKDDERDVFLEEYRRRLRVAYPVRPDGTVLYRFRRLFIVAVA